MPEIYDLDKAVKIICKLNPHAPPATELRKRIIESAKNMERYPDITGSATLGYLLLKKGEDGFEMWISPSLLDGKI